MGLAGGLNLYGYANGDPVNYADPFGLCPIEKDGIPCTLEWGGVGAAAGLTFGLAVGTATTAGTGGLGLPVALGEVGATTATGALLGASAGLLVDAKDVAVLAARSLSNRIRSLIAGLMIGKGGGMSDEQKRTWEGGEKPAAEQTEPEKPKKKQDDHQDPEQP